MTETSLPPFAPEVVAAIARHMNEDHSADSVLICRALGGQPGTTAATMTGLDAAGIAQTCRDMSAALRVAAKV